MQELAGAPLFVDEHRTSEWLRPLHEFPGSVHTFAGQGESAWLCPYQDLQTMRFLDPFQAIQVPTTPQSTGRLRSCRNLDCLKRVQESHRLQVLIRAKPSRLTLACKCMHAAREFVERPKPFARPMLINEERCPSQLLHIQ